MFGGFFDCRNLWMRDGHLTAEQDLAELSSGAIIEKRGPAEGIQFVGSGGLTASCQN
jgi:hypothetical protein